MIKKIVELKNGPLYYEIKGEGPSILFIHGGTLDMSMWDDQFNYLSSSFNVIRYDIRGYGKSPAPSTEYSHVDDIKQLLSHLEINKVHLVGLSLGGGIAINFALTYPDSILSIITLDSTLGGFQWGDDMMSILKEVWMDGKKRPIEDTKGIWIKSRLFEPTRQNTHAFDKLKQMIDDYSGYHWKNKDTSIGLAEPAISKLSQIKIPLLAVVGELDMKDYHQIAELLSENTMNGSKRIVKGAGHMVNLEKPSEINKIINNFISNV